MKLSVRSTSHPASSSMAGWVVEVEQSLIAEGDTQRWLPARELAEGTPADCHFVGIQECKTCLEFPDEGTPGVVGKLDDGLRADGAALNRERPSFGHVGVGPTVWELKAQRADDLGVCLGKDATSPRQERGQLLSVEPVEVDRTESFLLHDRNVAVPSCRRPGRTGVTAADGLSAAEAGRVVCHGARRGQTRSALDVDRCPRQGQLGDSPASREPPLTVRRMPTSARSSLPRSTDRVTGRVTTPPGGKGEGGVVTLGQRLTNQHRFANEVVPVLCRVESNGSTRHGRVSPTLIRGAGWIGVRSGRLHPALSSLTETADPPRTRPLGRELGGPGAWWTKAFLVE